MIDSTPSPPEGQKSILVLGSGNFGTCLAHHLSSKGHAVTIWGRSSEVVDGINQHHMNPRYLTGIELCPRLKAVKELKPELISQTELIVLAVPTQVIRKALTMIQPHIAKECLIVCAAKGIENETLLLPLDIIEENLGNSYYNRAVILSGPSFAIEVVKGLPTAVSMGSFDPDSCRIAQETFHTPFFRAYTTEDPIGLEVAGALKNVMAIASGACAGMGLQNNSQAALMTRGMAEITRVGYCLGANPITFNGLGGIGDLFLTCTSEKSRNYSLGFMLGKGLSIKQALNELKSVAEGWFTAKAAYELSLKLGTDTPVIDQVYAVLYEQKPLKEALEFLINRDMKPEITLPEPPMLED